VSPATYQAWLSTLELAGQDPSASTSRNTAEGAAAADVPAAHASAPITLACRTAFQRDQVERRYRRLIEHALGAPIVLVVAPAAQ
jgi:hypothetical protein